eukprot:scaffold178405_cov30-Tisochrysis_lutea.AAC.2
MEFSSTLVAQAILAASLPAADASAGGGCEGGSLIGACIGACGRKALCDDRDGSWGRESVAAAPGPCREEFVAASLSDAWIARWRSSSSCSSKLRSPAVTALVCTLGAQDEARESEARGGRYGRGTNSP